MKRTSRIPVLACHLFALAFIAAWTEPSRAAITFTHTTDLVTEAPSSRGVAAADFNRDGALDLVLTGSEDASIEGSVSVFLGNGDGTFGPRTTYPLPYGALAVAAADVNSDTFPDLVVGTIASYMLMLGNGDGSFAPATLLESIGIPFVTFADLNADGRPDVVASTASSVRIHLGNGDGTFRPAIAIAFPDCVYGEALHGDFNNDSRTDLAVIRCVDVVSILLGNGDGTFQSPVDYPSTHGPNGGDVGDLNSDGRLDLVIANHQTSTVSVLMGNGDGTFAPGATIATGDYPIDAALEDLNSDHIADLVVATYFGNALEVSEGRGDGTFETKTGYATGFCPSVAVGDWDRDGLLDIAASNWGGALPGSRISLFRNTTGVPVLARAFTTNSYRTIRLASGKPFWCVAVEAVGESFNVVEVNPETVVLRSSGTGSVSEIHAVTGKAIVVGDADDNDVRDVTFCFRKEDLRQLFSNINGKSTVNVSVGGDVITGGSFLGEVQVEVVGTGDALAASVSPNPLNPSAMLTFTTTRPGFAKVEMFDIAGRRVRTILGEPVLQAGEHAVRIEGRGPRGESLASGIYFIRGVSAEGQFTKTIAILK